MHFGWMPSSGGFENASLKLNQTVNQTFHINEDGGEKIPADSSIKMIKSTW